jgi:Nitrile hydratase beta subunit
MSARARYDVLMALLPDTAANKGQRRTLPDLDHTPEAWEENLKATCECLSSCGRLDNTERRHAEDELGETVYAGFPVHTRSVLVVAQSLMERGEISEDELRAKMKEVRTRLESD